jgi:transcriptional regulator with XRE-family HTH domain
MTKPKKQFLKGLFHAAMLRKLRTLRGRSVEEFAVKVGVSRNTVLNWELGHSIPKRSHLRRLAAVLNVSISTLYTERKDMQ